MSIGPVVGHQWAVELLQNSIQHDTLRHSYLFVGAAQLGKSTLARSFGQTLLCTEAAAGHACGNCRACRLLQTGGHPDFQLLPPTDRDGQPDRENGLHRAEQAADIIRQALLHPMEGRYKVFLIQDAHKANASFANKLLKTLEEPPAHVILCLTAQDRSTLLPTIVSRCQVLALRPLGEQTIEDALRARWGASPQQAALLARLANGCLGWAVEQLNEAEPLADRSQRLTELRELSRSRRVARLAFAQKLAAARSQTPLFPLLALWTGWWRDVMIVCEGRPELVWHTSRRPMLESVASGLDAAQSAVAVKAVERVVGLLERNVNPRLAVEELMLAMPHPIPPDGVAQP